MKYSVIIPFKTFNLKYFDRCCDSILNQSIKPNELIFIDDSGKKNGAKKYINLKFKNQKIKIIKNKKNMGVCYSLNKGIKISKNKIIFRIDIDDEWKPHHVGHNLNIVKKNPKFLFYSNNIRYHSIKNFIKLDNFLVVDNPFLHSSLIINMNVRKIKYLNLLPEDFGTLSFYQRCGFDIYSVKRKTVNIYNTPGSQGKKITANKDFFKISTENLKYLTKLVETSSFYKKIIYQLILLKISIIKLLLFRHI